MAGEGSHPPSQGNADHIARWHPERVLAECEAKWRIVDIATSLAIDEDGKGDIAAYGEDIQRLLALPYVDHLDYREEWRP